jgi:hypothetical protein
MAVRKKVKKAPARRGVAASPARRRRKTATGGGATGGPRSPRTRKPRGGKLSHMGPGELRRMRNARRRGR